MSIDWIETGSFNSSVPSPGRQETLHVVSWNIARGCRIGEIAEFLVSKDADLILLQESDYNARRTEHRNVARDLAQTLGMNYAFGIEFQELGQGSLASPAYHGQATLSPWPLVQPRIIRFKRQSKFWQPRWWIPPLARFQRRIGGRVALVTRVIIGDLSLAAYNVHFESRRRDDLRLAQLTELLDDAQQRESDVQLLVAGDFNFDLTANPQESLLVQAEFENPFAGMGLPTISGPSAPRAIDWILIRGRAQARSAQVHSLVRASDHYPLSLMLELA
jgi:endonuclease/exonuclease/phosphatase family metal-dependent hydrolase